MVRVWSKTAVGPHGDEGDHHQAFEEGHQGVGGHGDLADPKVHVHGARRAVLPVAAALGLHGQRLDRAHAGDGLHQHGLALGLGVVEGLEPGAEGGDQAEHHRGDDAGEDQDDEGELDRVEEQHRQQDDQHGGIEQGEKQPPGEELADLLRLLHVAGDDPGGAGLEVGDGQFQQVGEGLLRQADVDAVGGVEQEVLAQEGEHRIEQQGERHPAGQDIQGRVALVDDDLVDDQLHEDGHGQRQDVEHQGADGHVAQELALAEEFGDEPAQAEGLFVVEQRVVALEQDQLARPRPAQKRAWSSRKMALGGLAKGSRTAMAGPVSVSLTPTTTTKLPLAERRDGGQGLAQGQQVRPTRDLRHGGP